MKSIIKELQEKAHNVEIPVEQVVRFALIVAQRLGLADFKKFLLAELNGYAKDTEIPNYRIIYTTLEGWNHLRGVWLPVNLGIPQLQMEMTTCQLHQPIGELERQAQSHSKGMLSIPLRKDQEEHIKMNLEPRVPPSRVTRLFHVSQVQNIVSKVRNTIFIRSVELEDAGVAGMEGDELIFSEKEKEAARQAPTMNYYAENQIIVHSMQASQIQQAAESSSQSYSVSPDIEVISKIVTEIKDAIAALDLTKELLSEIEADLESLNAQIKSPYPKKTILEGAVTSLIRIFGSVPGEVAAGIVLKLLGIYG
jgi:hypothetical protein